MQGMETTAPSASLGAKGSPPLLMAQAWPPSKRPGSLIKLELLLSIPDASDSAALG